MYINEIDILNNWSSIKSSIANSTKTYVFPWNGTYHSSYFTAVDIDGDNIKEIVARNNYGYWQAKDWRDSWIWVYKFWPASDLKQWKWIWSTKWKDFDWARSSNWGREEIPIEDFDWDWKKDLVTWHLWTNATSNWQTYIYDLTNWDKKILKVKYQDQDADSPQVLDWTDNSNYRIYTRECPSDLRQNYSEDDRKRALCEIANFEFETPTTIDRIDLRVYSNRSIYNYKIEATKDLINWTTVTPSSSENNTTANFTWWITTNFTSDTYKAFRVYMSKSVNDSNAWARLQRIRFFNGGVDLTTSLKDKIYIWKSDWALPGYWHSDSWMYWPIQTIWTEKVIPMYLWQRHGMYKINQEKTWPNGIYFDLMYNFNKTVWKNWTLYQYNKNQTQDYLNHKPSFGWAVRVPIQPIWDWSIWDFIITDWYNVKFINWADGTLKTDFNYPSSWSNQLLYYWNLGKEEWIWFIQSFWDGKTRIVSLSKNTELWQINTWNYYANQIIVADINNDWVQEITTIDGFNNRIVLDVASASPIQSPNKIWWWNPWWSVYSTFDPDELVLWSDQWKDIVMTRNTPLWIVNGSFTRNRHPKRWSWWEYFQYGMPFGDKEWRWYKKWGAEYTHTGRRGTKDWWRRDWKNKKLNQFWNNRQARIRKQTLDVSSTIWRRMFLGIYYFHNSQRFAYEYNNDWYDDIVLNREYSRPIIISWKDWLPLKMIQHSSIYNWHPIVWNFDTDPELELYWHISDLRPKILNPKEWYIYESVVWTTNWRQSKWNHGKFWIIDINKDGVWETFAQYVDWGIYIFDKDMRVIKKFYVYEGKVSLDPISWAWFANSITSIDIDSDGKYNLMVAWNDWYIYAINPHVDMTVSSNLTWEGTSKAILWSYKVWANVSRLAFADIRNRWKTDIVFSAWDWFIRVLTQASITKPQKVNDGPTTWVNLEFTQDTTKIWANWTKVDGATWYIVKFVSDSWQEIVPETPVLPDGNWNIPTSILIENNVSLQVWKRYFAMVKAFDTGWVSEYTISDGIEVVWFSITKQVRNASDPNSQFQNEITVWPWEMVQYRILITNKTNRVAWWWKYDVSDPTNPIEVSSCDWVTYCEDRAIVIEDYMPQWFTYIAWSTIINWYSRSSETSPYFVFDGTNTQTNLPTVAWSVLRWKLPKTDLIEPYWGQLELLFTARAK